MKSDKVEVVLMAGGKGTRLRPFTSVLPKPLVPLGDISIMEMVLQQLASFGFSHVTISVGYKAEIIMAVIGDGHRFGLKINYHMEEEPLGTLGALAMMENLAENVLVMNGDICTDMNFMTFFKAHVDNGAAATISAYIRREKLALGILDVEKEGRRIVGFREKPEVEYIVSMGVNAFNHQVLDKIPKNTFFGFDDMMYRMLDEGVDLQYWTFDGLWYDVGRPDDYERMLESFGKHRDLYLPGEEVSS